MLKGCFLPSPSSTTIIIMVLPFDVWLDGHDGYPYVDIAVIVYEDTITSRRADVESAHFV